MDHTSGLEFGMCLEDTRGQGHIWILCKWGSQGRGSMGSASAGDQVLPIIQSSPPPPQEKGPGASGSCWLGFMSHSLQLNSPLANDLDHCGGAEGQP